jgi:hypothetical protein
MHLYDKNTGGPITGRALDVWRSRRDQLGAVQEADEVSCVRRLLRHGVIRRQPADCVAAQGLGNQLDASGEGCDRCASFH